MRGKVAFVENAPVLDAIARNLVDMKIDHPLRVGVDGICGAGKTTFRRALAGRLRRGSRTVVEIDSDGFHHPRAVRYRQGRGSARGYYEDAYDLDALARLTLDPLGESGNRVIVTQIHDLETDETVRRTAEVAPDAVVLFDCTFIQRGALRKRWDVVIYLDSDESAARGRGIERDQAAFGSVAEAGLAYDRRYLAACHLYLEQEHPLQRADIVIDNTDPLNPRFLDQPQEN
jgi:uridine kinase